MSRTFLLVALLLAACSRPAPSPEYSAARERYGALVAAHPADAATRPEMDEVLSALERVPEKSADAAVARELRDRILRDRQALRDEVARRADLVARAGAPESWPAETSIGQPPPKPPAIRPGMKLEEFTAVHGSCFERSGEIRIGAADGKERPGEAWAVRRSDAECATRYAPQLEQLVLVADGVVVGVRPAADAKPVVEERTVRGPPREVELVAMPGGKWGIKGADGKVEPVPAGAELRTRDGKPVPAPPAEPKP